ncbi:deacylase/carboxypeptidase superfamily protein [Gemmatimonadetes bacterium T265]|nr:deacylase/carboxypeptidase superfamily protein [Gemmatimonadetes bacterium T265]
MRSSRRFAALSLPALLAAAPRVTAAQPLLPAARDTAARDDRRFDFAARGPYRPEVPRPEALLGYPLGARNTQYGEQERVLLAVADAARDRVRVEEIGASHEGRRMRVFVVSAPENIARLDAIRADLGRLADPRVTGAAEAAVIAARTPAVVWISESVHGNESPGFESGMQLLYQFAASTEPATLAALRRAVVVINPSSNPDGHERFAVWYNSVARSDPANDAYEHREPWSIQGRFNHYRFDMNRDVIASTQPEVQAIMGGMLRWHPQVAVDQHGQVPTYFFPPAARPVNANIGPEGEKWLAIIGRANAAAFDAQGWQYFVRNEFDLYYPGYWDTWPSLNGATGMTYETDGGGWKGIAWRREDGSLLSFRDGIAKHWTAAMATIEATAARASERLVDYAAFRRHAVEQGRTGRMRQVVLVPGADPQRAAELAAALVRAGVEVRQTNVGFASARAHAYGAGSAIEAPNARGAARRFAGGAYVVDLAQPQGRLARAVLEPAPVLDSTFARRQVERFRRNLRRAGASGEDAEFYDITAWSLPLAFGVEAYWTEDAAGGGGALLQPPSAGLPGPPLAAADAAAPYAARPVALAGPAAAPYGGAGAEPLATEPLATPLGGGVTGGVASPTAYLFTAAPSGAAPLAFRLLASGYRVDVATDSVEAGGRLWPRGTFVLVASRNDPSLRATLDRLARERGVPVTPVASAYTERAQFGIGSSALTALKRPRVAVVGDEGVSQTAFGALWWTMDRRWSVDFVHLNWAALANGDLSRFDVIVVPDGSPGAIGRAVGGEALARLKSWARAGGTLVTMGGATEWAARPDVDLTSARRVGGDTTSNAARPATADTTAPPRDDLLAVTSPGAAPNTPAPVPGAMFDAVLDRTHWLTFGYDQPRVTALVEGGTFLRLSREGTNVAVFPRTGPVTRAGFTWPGNTERLLRNTALVVEEPLGRGHVVLFQNDPTFRGWVRSMDRLVLNAVLLGPSF